MGTASQTLTHQRVVSYLPLWLVHEIDAEVGLTGASRTDVIRQWLRMVARHKDKQRQQ